MKRCVSNATGLTTFAGLSIHNRHRIDRIPLGDPDSRLLQLVELARRVEWPVQASGDKAQRGSCNSREIGVRAG